MLVGRLDPAALYAEALDVLPDAIDGQTPLPVAAECRFTLNEVLAED